MASNKENVGSSVPHECFYRCNWPEHCSNLTAALSKASLTDEKVAAYLKWCCVRFPWALDTAGRSLIHVAVSKGRLKLLNFLLNHPDVNINAKDKESLYTPLHRSLFYGQLHCAVRLIQRGASLQQTDSDDLTPLDHVMKDRPKILEYDLRNPCEVYVWGTNTNYTLGISHHHSRVNPEPLPYFRKPSMSIKQVVMDKFHSVFVGSNGQVWACGHGLSGRCGLGDEITALVPKQMKIGSGSSKSDACCRMASIGTDHTVLLMENGSVWTCGLNKYHQLGHNPPPEKVLSPKQVKGLKGAQVVGVSASRFHTAFWTKSQLFTCGLHGGQLGHIKGDSTVPTPKLVTAVQLKDTTIDHVATSEGATVLINNKGDVFLVHEYQCKKLTPRNKPLKAKKICVIGGHLDHKTCSTDLKEKGGDELKILLLESGTNKLYLWQENAGSQFTRCIFSLKRQIELTDICLNRFSILISTVDGEAFQGEVRAKKKKMIAIEPGKVTSPKSTYHDFVDKDECEHVKLKRIPHIHRAVRVTSDLKGRNFAAIQVHPKSGLLQVPFVESTEMSQNMKTLLETADVYDTVHDAVFEVGLTKYPAHRYVMAFASNVFEEMLDNAPVVDGVAVVKVTDVLPETFKRILVFAYTNDCDLLRPYSCSARFGSLADPEVNSEESQETIDEEAVSAYEFRSKKAASKKKKQPPLAKPVINDPLKLLREAAKKFGMTNLLKKLQLVKYENGSVLYTSQRRFVPDNIRFDRKSLQHLWDVTLKSSDNVEIKAHKCILTARLEYFNCLINQGWLESSQKSPVKMPIPARVLELLIRHLYTDEAPELVNGEDGDLASLVLVFADQYLCLRLKEYAETGLANLLSLRNAVEMLQMAETYNAPQLKQCSMEFICLNLPALLESRSLEALGDEVLSELRDFYRSWLPCMKRRHISTHVSAPDDDLVDLIYAAEPVVLDSVSKGTLPAQKNAQVSKKKIKDKKNTETGRTRNPSVGSLTSDEELIVASPESLSSRNEEVWVKVTNHPSKQQRIVQTRLKVASEAAETPSTPVQFTKLVSDKTSPRIDKIVEKKYEKEIVNVLTTSEIDFPSLNASPSERTFNSTPVSKSSSVETPKKFTRLSQKQRKRLATVSISEDEEIPKSPDVIKSVWGIPKYDSTTLSEISMQKDDGFDFDFRRNKSILASSPTCKDPSLSSIMAAEKHQRSLINKLKSKPLQYTQMEDKAIEDLLLLYDVKNVTDEKITVKRAETVFISTPVWVSSHK